MTAASAVDQFNQSLSVSNFKGQTRYFKKIADDIYEIADAADEASKR